MGSFKSKTVLWKAEKGYLGNMLKIFKHFLRGIYAYICLRNSMEPACCSVNKERNPKT